MLWNALHFLSIHRFPVSEAETQKGRRHSDIIRVAVECLPRTHWSSGLCDPTGVLCPLRGSGYLEGPSSLCDFALFRLTSHRCPGQHRLSFSDHEWTAGQWPVLLPSAGRWWCDYTSVELGSWCIKGSVVSWFLICTSELVFWLQRDCLLDLFLNISWITGEPRLSVCSFNVFLPGI